MQQFDGLSSLIRASGIAVNSLGIISHHIVGIDSTFTNYIDNINNVIIIKDIIDNLDDARKAGFAPFVGALWSKYVVWSDMIVSDNFICKIHPGTFADIFATASISLTYFRRY